MKILLVGAKGMLGRDVAALCERNGVAVAGYDLPELDISGPPEGLSALPVCDRMVNCAAYTNVDGAESEREAALAVNRDGARHLAQWCKARAVPLLHVSTDYVFDGSASSPYREEDAVSPLNAYGESKLAGEDAVREICNDALIVRTQSLFGTHGHNFVKTITRKLKENAGPLRVVDDQVSCPTYTAHLADAILRLLKCGKQGLVHVSASGECSWYAFARAIADHLKPGASVLPVGSSEYPRPARRPAYSVLDKSRYTSWTGHEMPSWQEGLRAHLAEEGAPAI
jgi:dTDP-4-dehydrorhamnose reductase